MPQWSVAEWRARIGGSWLAIGRPIKSKSSSSSGGAGCMWQVLTINRVVTMMSLTLILIGVSLFLRVLLSRGHLWPITDLLEFGILSHWNLYWVNPDNLHLSVSTLLFLYEFFPSTIVMQFAFCFKQGLCLISQLLCVLTSIKSRLICPLLLLTNFVVNDHSWSRAVSVLRIILIGSDQVAMLKPNSSVFREELELRDRGELLRRLALSSVQLDIVLSVAVYVIIYKLLKSGDIEKNPGPRNLDYNNVDASTTLDDGDLPDVMEEIISIQSKFYDLGRSLRVKIHDLKRIRNAFRNDSDSGKALEEVLLLWLDQKYDAEKYGCPTWRMLVKAVDMKTGGNDQELANQIASRHHATATSVRVQSSTLSQHAKESKTKLSKVESRHNPATEEIKENSAKEKRHQTQSRHAVEIDRAGVLTKQTEEGDTEEGPLGIGNVREVLDELWKYRTKWKFIGLELQIDPGDLDAIGVNNRTVEDALLEVIKLWLRRVNPKPTRTVLTAVTLSKLLVTKAATESDIASTQEGHTQTVEEYTQYLKSLYKAQTLASFSDDQWPPPCTDKVFRLAMIRNEESRIGDVEDNAVLREKTISGRVDDVLQRMIPIDVKDIFKVEDQCEEVLMEGTPGEVEDQCEEIKKVLMEGAPGSGKSTLSFHMCRQWMEGHLFQEFKLVILVRLREPAVQNATSLVELLPRRNEAMGIEIEGIITASDGKEVLIVLDGWDELPQNVPAYSMILDLVKGNKLPETSIIVTSRPTSSAILHQLVHLQIEILGFTKDELQQYFTKCLENNAEAVHRLLQRIKQNPVIEGSCYLPLNASILVHLFKCGDNVLPTTQYGIFTELVCTCIFRHLKKTHQVINELESLDELPPSTAAQFRHLCRVAYDGVIQDKVIFDLGPNFNTLGLLQCIESFAKRGKSYSYNFLHLSIQELLCALHMVNELDERKQTKQFKKLFGKPRFMLVFQFFAAKTKLKTSGISEIVSQFAKKCSSDHASREDRTLLVSLMHCLFEAQDSSLCQLVANELKQKLMIGTFSNGIRLNSTDCYYLGYFLTFCDGFDVNLSSCSIGVDHCKSLFRSGKVHNLRSLDLWYNNVGDKGAMTVAAAVKTATNLQELNLQYNNIGDKGAMAVAAAMKTATYLRTLFLTRNAIGDKGAMAVAAAMKTASNLQVLDLSVNVIGVKGAMTVAAAMKTATNLRVLNFSVNDIGREGKDSIRSAAKRTGTKIYF